MGVYAISIDINTFIRPESLSRTQFDPSIQTLPWNRPFLGILAFLILNQFGASLAGCCFDENLPQRQAFRQSRAGKTTFRDWRGVLAHGFGRRYPRSAGGNPRDMRGPWNLASRNCRMDRN